MYKKSWFWVLVLPALALFLIVIVIPSLTGAYLSFTNWRSGNPNNPWVGLDNYKVAIDNGNFTSSISYTLVFTIVSVIFVNLIGFIFAYLLTMPFKGKNFFRGVFFLPNLIGGLVLGYLWQQLFDYLLPHMFGGESLRIKNRWTAMIAMSMVLTWQMSGYVMVIYVAALQNVSKVLKEVAAIEGSSLLRKFFSVTLPAVMPAITVSLFLTLSNSFKMFDLNLSLTDGFGNNRDLLAKDIYETAFGSPLKRQTFGIAQSKAVIFTLLVSSIAITQVVISKRFEVDS